MEPVAYMVLAPGGVAKPVLTAAEAAELVRQNPGAVVRPMGYLDKMCDVLAAVVNQAFRR